MKEDYCSFEISKLLKEKGFKQEGCHKSYSMEGPVAPTYQMATKWLREAHKLSVEPISVYNGNNKVGFIYLIASMTNRDEIYSQPNNIPYDTYEEAVEAALKYCLTKLI